MIRKYGIGLCVAVLAIAAALTMVERAEGGNQDARVFELRTYTVAEGRLQALLDRFGGGETELFEKHGMRGVGYWVPDEEPLSANTLVYMLSHESREAAAESWRAFLADPDWAVMREQSRADGPIVTNVESMFLNPTDFSPAR